MSVESHLAELERRHEALKREIHEAQSHPGFDEFEVAALKRRKLHIKDEIAKLQKHHHEETVEPMAARVEPGRVQAAHQSLHHFVAKADWSDAAVLAAVRAQVLPAIERQGPIRAWIVDDTGFPKKGKHSVGVARQYCGQLGKQDNCQIAVSLSVANDQASLPIAYRLYLPEAWANDPDRRAKAGVPEEVVFQTKPEIALDQIQAALAAGVPRGVVLADAGYGIDTAFRTGVDAAGPDLRRRHPVLDQPVAAGDGSLCRPSRGAAAVGRPRSCAAIPTHKPTLGQGTGAGPAGGAPGTASPGARAPTRRSPRASPPSASGRRIAITGAPPRGPRNGS